jgi:hypothetical protein
MLIVPSRGARSVANSRLSSTLRCNSLLRVDKCRAGTLLRNRGVVVLLAHRLLRDQPRLAREVLLRIDEVRLRLREARLGLRELRFERALIDDVKRSPA